MYEKSKKKEWKKYEYIKMINFHNRVLPGNESQNRRVLFSRARNTNWYYRSCAWFTTGWVDCAFLSLCTFTKCTLVHFLSAVTGLESVTQVQKVDQHQTILIWKEPGLELRYTPIQAPVGPLLSTASTKLKILNAKSEISTKSWVKWSL